MIAFNKADKANSESEENLVQALEEEMYVVHPLLDHGPTFYRSRVLFQSIYARNSYYFLVYHAPLDLFVHLRSDELRTSKEAVVTDNLTGDGDDEELTKDVFVLGTLGRKFSLRLDSPCPVTVCKTSSVKPVDLSKVRDFILDSISH